MDEDHLRFDFSHYSAMTAEELDRVNALVQEAVFTGYGVDIKEMSIDEAKEMGATALFSEKYGDTVRVVNMGGYSIELCGGTHLDNTAKVGPFRIVSESSVAAGVRRIEAITGKAYMADAAKTRDLVGSACAAVKVKNPADLSDKLNAQLDSTCPSLLLLFGESSCSLFHYRNRSSGRTFSFPHHEIYLSTSEFIF